MEDKEHTHGLGKKRAGYLNGIAKASDRENVTDANWREDSLSSDESENWFYSEMLVSDTGLAEMWMELRV